MRTQIVLSIAVAAAGRKLTQEEPIHDTLPDLPMVLTPSYSLDRSATGQVMIAEEYGYNPSLLPPSMGAITLDPTMHWKLKSGRYELHQPSPLDLAVKGYFSIQTQAECAPRIELVDYYSNLKYQIGTVVADPKSEMMARDPASQKLETSYVGNWAVGHDTTVFRDVAYIPENEETLFQYQVSLVLPEKFDNGQKECEYILKTMGLHKKYPKEYDTSIKHLRSETLQPHQPVKDLI